MKPTLVIMVGIPGSGKSDCAAHLARIMPATVIAPSQYRRRFPDLDHSAIFERTRSDLKQLLQSGHHVICDSMNIAAYVRRETLAIGRPWAEQRICVWMDIPAEQAIARQAENPDGYFSPVEIRRKARRLEKEPPQLSEGFTEIVQLGPNDPFPHRL